MLSIKYLQTYIIKVNVHTTQLEYVMNKPELLNFKSRLNAIIKDCKELVKDIDKELEKFDPPKPPVTPTAPVVFAGAQYDFSTESQTVIDIFNRKDIDIFMVGLDVTLLAQTYKFNIVKDQTYTPISVAIPTGAQGCMSQFNSLMTNRWSPKTAQHLKSLLNKHNDRTIRMEVYAITGNVHFYINVTHTVGVALTNVRHRNVTYLFHWSVYNELNHIQQNMLMSLRPIKNEFNFY